LLHRQAPALLLAMALAPAVAGAKPFVPADDAEVLERLPPTVTAEKRALRRLRSALADRPHDLERATKLAWRYIAVSRAESDPRYRGYAQAVLAPWWALDHPPLEVLVLRATLHQARHDFDGALADLAWVLARDPRNAQAWLTRAVVLQVQGDYGAALSSCSRLHRLAGLPACWCRPPLCQRRHRAQRSCARQLPTAAAGASVPTRRRFPSAAVGLDHSGRDRRSIG